MKLITRDTDYGIRAMCYLAKHKDKRVSASELVSRLSIPRSFLRKILQVLHKEGVLSSYKGIGGGFVLTKPVDKIYLTDLIRIFQGKLTLNECLFKKIICPHTKTCRLRKKLNNIERYMLKELGSINISSLLG